MIAWWAKLPDGTLGVRVRGRPVVGTIVTVRYADAREPRREVVAEIVAERGDETLCRIERKVTT